ncbi:trypsin-like peptidase domain-containing protein [Paenibacillus sp. N1-5-1-14]|uniref:S1C family serine protease n=1 Tax=Paenibacillus radicibacter TaxID=2972488 RepID=UPI002158DC09|nr:trypsin-like peptidase domain-containing protein [Paenibacillus radicibacter]MCR8644838.1 trypsin-like peptidase domain-containing protein [Paenibacillus radicibacter]
MSNERNDYNDFFNTQGSDEEKRNDLKHNGEPEGEPSKDSSTYYSYGPYKNNQEQPTPVEMTPPQPMRQMPLLSNSSSGHAGASGGGGMPPYTTWTPPKKRSSFRSYAAVFLVGVLVSGALMFTADKMNLFTGGTNQPLAGTNNSSTNSGSSTNKPAGVNLGGSNNISSIVNDAQPAVVMVESWTKKKTSSGGSGSNPFLNDPWFKQFFGDEAPNSGQEKKQDASSGDMVKSGMGTGFIFEKSGYILTNQHVIDGADEIRIIVEGHEKPFVAKLLGNSPELDLACLKIEGTEDFPILPLGNSDEMSPGDTVIAIGNPYGFDHTVTVGVYSAKGREIPISDGKTTHVYKNLIQTDAAINPGNSGGPLLNTKGEVIGINTAVSQQAQGIGFAIPTSVVSSVLENLKNNVKIPKEPAPFVGISMNDIDKDWLSELKLSSTDGAIVADVTRKSPAFKAGIRPYDVVVDINGKAIKNSAELKAKIGGFKVGEKIKLGVMRDGKKIDVEIEIGDRNVVEGTE